MSGGDPSLRTVLLSVFAAALLMGALRGSVCASESYQDKTPTWAGSLASKSGLARVGHCTLECDHPVRHTNVRLHASSMTPNTVYSFFFTDYDGKEKVLGVGNGQATSDSKGWLEYSSPIAQCPLGDKLKITVRAPGPHGPETV
ncbi:MAG TPA: hypothetical protein VGO93_24165, partial [Candidatus Xenobia bacterium]